jgi:hypothetical protein
VVERVIQEPLAPAKPPADILRMHVSFRITALIPGVRSWEGDLANVKET